MTDYVVPTYFCKVFSSLPNEGLSNDFYAKDTSKKVRAIKRAQGQAGEHLTKPPYGYMVSPTDKKQWIVDEEAAAVVKRIFDLCIGGKGSMQIAKILKENKVLTAKAHKLKKRIPTTKEQQTIFYNTHEAIAEDAVFERAQDN